MLCGDAFFCDVIFRCFSIFSVFSRHLEFRNVPFILPAPYSALASSTCSYFRRFIRCAQLPFFNEHALLKTRSENL